MDGNIILNKQAFFPPPIEAWESCLHLVENDLKDGLNKINKKNRGNIPMNKVTLVTVMSVLLTLTIIYGTCIAFVYMMYMVSYL